MESSKVGPAIVLFSLTLCATFGFFVFAMNMLGVDVPFLSEVVLPQGRTIFMYFVSLVATTIISQFFAFWFANRVKRTLFKLFDKGWLPEAGKTDTYRTAPGERLEKVVPQSYLGTVVWEMATLKVPSVFLASIVTGGLTLLVTSLLGKPQLLLSLVLIVLVNSVAIAWSYCLKEWRRLHLKLVIFTTVVKYVTVETNFFDLLFGSGSRPEISTTPMSEILEKQVSADPQRFDPSIKTSWLRDRYTAWLSKKKNIRTLFLRSKSNEAQDTITWVDHGSGLIRLLDNLSRKSIMLSERQRFIDQEVIKMEVGKPDDDNWSRGHTEEAARLYTERFMKVNEPQKTYDLHRVEDPGFYDEEGDLLEEPAAVISGDIAADDEPEDVDVSSYFSRNGDA